VQVEEDVLSLCLIQLKVVVVPLECARFLFLLVQVEVDVLNLCLVRF
jgi:hypothetical protein